LKEMSNNADISSLGDRLMLEQDFANMKSSDIKRIFGEQFAANLLTLKPQQWQGPLESGYGLHLVFISEQTEGRVPPLEQVREEVRREWSNAKRVEANEKFYQALLKNYKVTIEPPEEKKLAQAR
jgi:parvulin-like peptidyl-prolyl isomerase